MADLDSQTRKNLAQQGKALSGENGGRFPIRNRDDLANAIRAVGRVRPNTEEARAKVRRFIIKRARQLDASSMIPDSWNSDGSLK
jgi:hypothetical protein